MKLIIDIPEDVRIAITRMGLLRISDEMQIKVDKAIQRGIPLDKIRAEISRCKTQHEMQIAERDTKSKLLISDIFCDVVEIIDRIGGDSE